MKQLLIKHYRNHRETIRNLIWRLLQIFGKQGITFLIFILCARLLSPYDFGIYNYLLAVIFLLIMFGDFGISTATSKYVAEYNAISKDKLKFVLFSSGAVILVLTLIIIVITIIFGPLYLKDKYIYALYLLPLVFLVPVTSLYDGIYRGLERFKKLAIISLSAGLISLSFVYILINQYGLIGALISQNIFYLILLFGLFFGYREYHTSIDRQIIRDIGKYSFIIGLSSIGYFFYSQISTLMLGHYGYITQISYYELLNKFFALLIMPLTMLGQVIAPRSTRFFALKQIRALRESFFKLLVTSIILAAIISVLLYFLLPIIISIFFKQYDILLLRHFLNIQIFIFFILAATATVNNGVITPTNYTKWLMFSSLFFGLVNLPISVVLYSYLSYTGLILSSLLVYILNVISIYIIYYKTTLTQEKI